MENLREPVQMADVIVRGVFVTFDFTDEAFGYTEVNSDIVL